MSGNLALMGFSKVKFFPIIKNTAEAYEVGTGFDMPWAQEMTREADTKETKIYADDLLYANLKSWNGMNATITLAEMPLELMAKLGFGTYDETNKTLQYNPEGKNLEFAVTFRCERSDRAYRMFKMFVFQVNEIQEDAVKTKGEETGIVPYKVIGTFVKRRIDNVPYEIADHAEAAWLDQIEKLPSVKKNG